MPTSLYQTVPKHNKPILETDSTSLKDKVSVLASSELTTIKAEKIAKKWNLPLVDQSQKEPKTPFILAITPTKIELREVSITKKLQPIFVDFLSSKFAYRLKHGGREKELLARAVGIKGKNRPSILDATAGFGTDAFILASLGCNVVMLERSPIIAILLNDALERLEEVLPHGAFNLSLKITQAVEYINSIQKTQKPEVIYLDPMYPQREKSALNKRPMRILQKLVGNDLDATLLLEASLTCAKNRIVVKRPRHADFLGAIKPNLQLSSGGSSRYDIYITK